MPELPEVETVRRILNTCVQNKRIQDVLIYDDHMAKDSKYPLSVLKGEKIHIVDRKGKYLIFRLDHYLLISHLRMEGKYYYHEKKVEKTPHTRIIFCFDDDTYLYYDDSRRFGTMDIYLIEEENHIPALSSLGKEPFELTKEELYNDLKSHHLEIKSILLCQNIIAGIGNIYADEILFESKISPFKMCDTLTLNEVDVILENAKRILLKAIDLGGSTIRSYHPSEGIDGLFQEELKAYGKENKPCIHCNTLMRCHMLHGRSVTYCPTCQNVAKVVAIYGKIASGKSTVLNYLSSLGYKTFSADKEVNDLYKKDFHLKAFCIHLFGEACLTRFGTINKNVIKKLIVNDENKKIELENYIHPLVKKRLISFIKNNIYEKVIFIEIPLLFEAKWDDLADEILGIDIPLDLQITHLKKRKSKNISRDLALNSSLKFNKNLAKCNDIIVNDGSLDELYQKVDTYLNMILRK